MVECARQSETGRGQLIHEMEIVPVPPFEHAVSILDLLFYCGPEAAYYIWVWPESAQVALENDVLIECAKSQGPVLRAK